MNKRIVNRIYNTLAAATIVTAMLSSNSVSAQVFAEIVNSTTHSPLTCVAKQSKDSDLLLPGARGLMNKSSTKSVVLLCPLVAEDRDTQRCGWAFNSHQLVVNFQLAPSRSGATAGRVAYIRTRPDWAAYPQGEQIAVARGQSIDPRSTWDRQAAYVSAPVSVTTDCLETIGWSSMVQIIVPPRAIVSAITFSYLHTNLNGT